MTWRITWATARRALTQIRHDHRSIALILGVPTMLMGLLAWMYSDQPGFFDQIGASLLGLFPCIVMFLITAVTTLRERRSGTLERLLAMPMGKADFLGGYALAFGLAATAQAVVVATLSLSVFGLDVAGPAWAVVLVAVADALLGTALGLWVSAFAATEFQAVQFMPAVIFPQLLLSGLLVARDQLPPVLEVVSMVMPLSYAVDAMKHLTTSPTVGASLWGNLAVVLGFTLAALVLGAATLRRRTP
jgi:ABC-2 type transport system permease protein